MKKYIIILTAFALTTVIGLKSLPGSAQSKTITGIVYDKHDNVPLGGVNVLVKGTRSGTVTDINGKYKINVPGHKSVLQFSFVGYITKEIVVKEQINIDVFLEVDVSELSEVVVTGYGPRRVVRSLTGSVSTVRKRGKKNKVAPSYAPVYDQLGDYEVDDIDTYPRHNTEEYEAIHENIFLQPTKNPLSTFSIDVDAASYSNLRRFLNNGQKPPVDAVRIEEMVNYFHYDYVQPDGEDPFSITTEIGVTPWNEKHQLVHIGLQGKKIPTDNLPPSNLVFLIDVSGSMSAANKLPLLKSSFKMLTKQLREQDRVAIVVYAGAAGTVLPSTPGNRKEKIISALDNLEAGGSTAGGAGIKLAYKIAKENFRDGGNNRVILATDGDFNVGASSNAEMERLIEEKRKDNIFLTVLGFGMGNYKDSKMETIADKGNGNYAYIDNIQEARKVLVNEFGGTLFTIAKDVKLQVEFNPAMVQAYRLIGYENRKLNKEDFNNDKKDAGDLGSGHTVTALYEIIPTGVDSKGFIQPVDELKYQKNTEVRKATKSDEILTLKLRYKKPEGTTSKLLVKTLKGNAVPVAQTSDNFRFSAAVAAFGMILRDSEFKSNANLGQVVALAKSAKGKDEEGYRAEFIKMVKSTDFLVSK
ncbi:von Willebrand factor type A domain-containing protein [Fulvivirgaceae bacterium BMA12]|uniref:von Willebrand factor type A domain-containing protein n=1 Tax=Agaribacillus aureus TaxID=3051825 RepID=A0ABT8L4L0_9BACT|nr:von Willebrand factor type A domain-containing protein [Fulvivirgaceae bacterium BMA12]